MAGVAADRDRLVGDRGDLRVLRVQLDDRPRADLARGLPPAGRGVHVLDLRRQLAEGDVVAPVVLLAVVVLVHGEPDRGPAPQPGPLVLTGPGRAHDRHHVLVAGNHLGAEDLADRGRRLGRLRRRVDRLHRLLPAGRQRDRGDRVGLGPDPADADPGGGKSGDDQHERTDQPRPHHTVHRRLPTTAVAVTPVRPQQPVTTLPRPLPTLLSVRRLPHPLLPVRRLPRLLAVRRLARLLTVRRLARLLGVRRLGRVLALWLLAGVLALVGLAGSLSVRLLAGLLV